MLVGSAGGKRWCSCFAPDGAFGVTLSIGKRSPTLGVALCSPRGNRHTPQEAFFAANSMSVVLRGQNLCWQYAGACYVLVQAVCTTKTSLVYAFAKLGSCVACPWICKSWCTLVDGPATTARRCDLNSKFRRNMICGFSTNQSSRSCLHLLLLLLPPLLLPLLLGRYIHPCLPGTCG